MVTKRCPPVLSRETALPFDPSDSSIDLHRVHIRTLSFDRDRFADWRHWLPPVLEVLLVVLLAAQAARLLWLLLVPIPPLGASAATMPLQAAAPSLSLVDLFFRSSRPPPPSGIHPASGFGLTARYRKTVVWRKIVS